MPKKRAPLQYTKPSIPAHPSLSSSSNNNHGLRSPNLGDASAEKSVNQLIQDLRVSQAHAIPKERLQGPLNPQTVHPSLKSILQVPDTRPPRPGPGMRAARGIHGRGPAGPPPPISWLTDSIHVPAHVRQRMRIPGEAQARYERPGALPDQYLPDEHSLVHQTLKELAKTWDWHVEYNQFYLAALPMRYKQALLSYIAFYNPQSITCHSLGILFLDDTQLEDATGSENLTHLDLATSINHPLGLKELKDFFTKKRLTFSKNTTTISNEPIPETWDLPIHSFTPTISRFPSLTHLSFAHPSSASWRSLLVLTPHLATLTHLSLAHWPVPSLTPNSKNAFRTIPRGDVDYGGSNQYGHYDCDFSEAGGVLRRLSRGLLCLKWLDLTGCGEWIRALGAENGADWNGAWRSIETVKVGQGWLPDCVKDETEQWKWLWRGDNLENWGYVEQSMSQELKTWVQFEKNIRAVEQEVSHIIARQSRPAIDGRDTVAEETPSPLPGTWWEYGSDSKPVGSKIGPLMCRVRFERGWEGWWIEDALREMVRRPRFSEDYS